MISILKKLLQTKPIGLTKRDLIEREAAIGKQLFGPIPEGHDRDFFYLGDHTWVWQETWKDELGSQHTIQTRYEVYPDRIIKVQDGHPNRILDARETRLLRSAVEWYYYLTTKHVYNLH